MKKTIVTSLCLLATFTTFSAEANLITNPGFESSLNGWTKTGSFTAVKTAHSGIYAARAGTGAGTLTQKINVTAGKKYTISAYGKLDSMSVSSMLAIRFKTSSGGWIDEVKMVIGSTAYKLYTNTFTVPAKTAYIEVYAQKDAYAASYVYLDTLSLVEVGGTTTPVNAAPALAGTQAITTNEDVPVTFNLNLATDSNNDPLTYIKVSDPASGSLKCDGGSSRSCTYTPVANFNGTTTFTYKANDGKVDSNIATATINVTAVNDAPVIPTTQSVSTAFNTAAKFNLNAGVDVDGDKLSYIKVTSPANGTLTCVGGTSQECTFTPASTFNGTTSFTYKANDGKVDSNLATVSITVAADTTVPPVEPPPVEPPIEVPPTAPASAYKPLGVGGGGAMSGVSISPYTNLWFVGTDMGTLFKSTDLGQSWNAVNHLQAVFDSDLTRAVSVGFSADGKTVFHAAAGTNPKRSTDAGDTFTAMAMGLSSGEVIKYFYSDSSNANIQYAGTTKGLLRTTNNGTSWTRISSTTEEAVGTFIDHNTNGKVYHATKTKILVSNDDGVTFSTYYTPAAGSVRLFSGGSDVSGVTLAFSDSDGTNACSWVHQYLNDWGQTAINDTVANCGYVWINKNGAGFVKNAQSAGDHLKMAENDSATIYSTGSTKWIRQYGTKVYVSRDKGQTWGLKLNQINYDVVPYAPWPKEKLEWSAVALDVGWWDSGYESFAINQRNSAVVAGSGYFFVHSTLNHGENWKAPFTEYADTGTPTAGKKWKTRGLEVISIYRMKFHPTNTNLMYGASADIGGLVSEDKGVSFRIPAHQYNSFYDYAFDPNDDLVVYAAAGSLHDFPNEWRANATTGNGGIYKSTDRGRSFKRLTPVDTNYNRQFLSIGYDSRNDVIYAGSHEVGIAVSRNDGATWTYMNAGLPAGNKIIPQIEVDPNNGNVYALLTGDAPTFSNQPYTGVYLLDVANGATSWKLLRGTVNYPKDADAGYKLWYYPTAFAIDFNNPSTIWMVDYENKGNWLMTGAWKTTNGGATWDRMKQVTHAVDIKIDPKNNNQVHVAGYYQLDGAWGNGGMLYTKDGGTTWAKNTTPPLQRNARSVAFDPTDSSKIFYSYFGGGILGGPNPAK